MYYPSLLLPITYIYASHSKPQHGNPAITRSSQSQSLSPSPPILPSRFQPHATPTLPVVYFAPGISRPGAHDSQCGRLVVDVEMDSMVFSQCFSFLSPPSRLFFELELELECSFCPTRLSSERVLPNMRYCWRGGARALEPVSRL